MIGALPEILKKNTNSTFLVIGKTHPNIISERGEEYRDSLVNLTKKLDVEENVKFINRFLSFEEIIYYLQATDIYVTPYLEPEQITSGTLAYALGAGKTCISTPYAYAKEVLAKRRGCLVPFRDSKTIAIKINQILSSDSLRLRYSEKGYDFGRKMIWENIAYKYLTVFQEILK
jgi:glycosyltransferase involved in cell wall biosynthesis